MKTIKTTFLILTIAVMAVVFSSCKKEKDESPDGVFSKGIFIVNEGPFQTGSGTITFYKTDSNLIKQDIFEKVNSRPLGNIVQSMSILNDKGYIVINNAGKVEVVDIATFASKATITGLKNPSQFLSIDSRKAYVSDWVGKVAVIDLNTNTIEKQIPAGTGPDAMIKSGNYVFVSNTGGFGVDSTITVIDAITDKVVKVLQVGHVPSELVTDANGKIWLLCKGKGYNGWPQAGDTQGKLVRIDPIGLTVEMTYTFPSKNLHPEKLVINKQKNLMYFLYNYGIYKLGIQLTNTSIPEKVFSRSFYSLGYENKTGYLYAADAKNYVNNGIVLRIKADDGKVVDSIPSGISPRSFAFPE